MKTLAQAMKREAKEEIGIEIKLEDLNYSSMVHANFKGDEYILVAFHATKYEGLPTNMEPDKCSELKWFEIQNLPEEIADIRKLMIDDYLHHRQYREFGF